MRSSKMGRLELARSVFAATFLVVGLSACTPLAGGAALIGVVAIGALTSRCYDYIDVTVLDADGRKTCAATVTATKGKSQFELTSCYYASLTDGQWTLRASQPGAVDAWTTLQVDHAHDCSRSVQSLELTLKRPGAALPTPVVPPSPTPARSTLPPPPPPPPVEQPPGASSPSIEPPSAAPATSATPSPGVLPIDAPSPN